VAIKVISKSRLIKLNPKHMQQMESEIRIMKTLYHENIVNLNDVYVVLALPASFSRAREASS